MVILNLISSNNLSCNTSHVCEHGKEHETFIYSKRNVNKHNRNNNKVHSPMVFQFSLSSQNRTTGCSYHSRSNLCQNLASSPGHSQILSRSRGEKPRLRDKIWEWPGDEASQNHHP